MPNALDIERAVHSAVLVALSEKKVERHAVSNADHIIADLGFGSLELAVLLSRLEIALDGDPFAELVSITSVRTVGDICDAYRRLFIGELPTTEPEDKGAGRAEKRLSRADRRGE